jgi:hypothetical protein
MHRACSRCWRSSSAKSRKVDPLAVPGDHRQRNPRICSKATPRMLRGSSRSVLFAPLTSSVRCSSSEWSGKRRSSVTASYRDLAAPLHNTDRVSARREVTAPARAPIFWWEYADFTRRVMPDRVATSKPPCVSTLLEYHVVTDGPIRF